MNIRMEIVWEGDASLKTTGYWYDTPVRLPGALNEVLDAP